MMQLAQMKYGHNVDVPGRDPIPRAYYWCKKAANLGDVDGANTASQIEAGCKTNCAQCKKSALAETLNRCAKCKLYRYCGKECQVKHWKAGHKKDCVKAD